MRPLISILTILVATASCSPGADKATKAQPMFDTLPLPLSPSAFYFHTKKSWKDTTTNALDTFVNTWYSKMLFALKEPILSNYKGVKEIYRFTWLRTFHHPVSVRLEKQNNIIKLFSKVGNGAGGYEPGQIIADTTFELTINEYNLLLKKLEETNLWNLQTEKIDVGGRDGSEWIIEAVKNNRYHLAVRWTPSKEREGNFRTIGEYLISISRIKGETENFY